MDKECRWCEKIVDEEKCFASPIVGGDSTVWTCDYCGEVVTESSFKASNS